MSGQIRIQFMMCVCVYVWYIYYCVKMLAFIIIINFDDFVYYNNWFNFSQKYSNALNVDIPCPFEPGNNLINPHAYIKTLMSEILKISFNIKRYITNVSFWNFSGKHLVSSYATALYGKGLFESNSPQIIWKYTHAP